MSVFPQPLRDSIRSMRNILGARLRGLREGGVKVLLPLALLALPALAVVPYLAALKQGSHVYILPWLVYLLAQIAGALNYPTKEREVIHPFPRWYFWLIQVVCAGGAGVLAFWIQTGDASTSGATLPTRAEVAHRLVLFLASLSLLTTALPFLLSSLSSILHRVGSRPRLGRLRLPPWTVYRLLVLGLGGYLTFEIGRLWMLAIWLILVLGSVSLAKKLWDLKAGYAWAALPQLGFWTVALAVLLYDRWSRYLLTADSTSLDYQLLAAALAGQFVSTVYWLFLQLRTSPVEALDVPVADEALSVQTDPRRYVDTSRYGEQLLSFIRRSDGGVIGLTGIRGAGKSALITYALSSLGRRYFVLSMTAPIRHDPGLAFLSTVCRGVCRKVLDDISQILQGRSTEEGRARAEVLKGIRNVALPIILACLMVAALIDARTEVATSPDGGWFLFYGDPLCEDVLAAERLLVDDLLRQIDAVAKESAAVPPQARYTEYLLVPNSDKAGWALFPRSAGLTEADQLRGFNQPSGPVSLLFLYSWLAGDSLPLDVRLRLSESSSPPNCRAGTLLGNHMPALQRFFQAAPQDPPGNGASASPLPAVEPYPLFSFLVLDKYRKADPALSLSSAELMRLKTLLNTYRYTLDGRTVPPPPGRARSSGIARVLEGETFFLTAMVLVPVALFLLLGASVWRGLSFLARGTVNWRYTALHREAEGFLEELNFTESRAAKGGFSWRGLSMERSRSLAARDLTLPGLTARYIDFVQSVRRHYNGKVVIAIDELDKIHDPEMVKNLLTEIKGALFTKGCYYLISISEDATRAFRQRLSSGRDIFESTFDEIIEIPRMSVETATQMIDRRLESTPEPGRLPDACYFVLVLFGGGIPREIVRHLRTIALAHEADAATLEPKAVATELLRAEMREWGESLGEVELSGGETIALRDAARDALSTLRGPGFDRGSCGRVWDCLDRCLDLIDPLKLRRTADPLAAPAEPAALRYKAIVDDIQACLRLMIMTTVCEMVWREEDWKRWEEAFLDTYRALADKPALAETMLREIRAEWGIAPA